MKNNFIHLTNNAIQKYSPNYGKLEEGNQLPLKMLEPILKKGLSWLRYQMGVYVRLSVTAAGDKLWDGPNGF